MLKSLKISGLAVINSLEVDFHPGLNVLTGETGSGKSIIVDALGLLLGERGSSAQIRTGENKASIEGVFTLTDGVDAELCEVLNQIGLENSLELIIHREIHITGKGRISINGISVAAGTLRKLQPFLSEIYGQGEQRSLLSASSHRDLLDHFGGCAPLKNDVRKLYLRLKSTEGDLKSLVSSLVEREHSKDLTQHQLTEINALNPKRGEDDELLAERELLRFSIGCDRVATMLKPTAAIADCDERKPFGQCLAQLFKGAGFHFTQTVLDL
jgi:DNA repair protein RecN (Recombination protein N)